MSGERATGLGVDSSGSPVIDPTANVIALVQANKEAADTLRAMHDRYISAEIQIVRETVKWMEKISDVHQAHDREIHKMEQEKLAAFRTSDESARLTEADRTLAAVQLVARTAETTAQDIRNVLTNTATTLAEQNAARDREYNNRIAALEKANYEGAGKGTGAKNLWFIIAAIIVVLGFLTTEATVLVGVVLYVSRKG
jgi:hypothetical protein